ncbi:dihydromonapterin reductase [Marinomonas sp.]|nr:dihydromonapterin reductase [Marinomonas sp.]MDB4837951.1 dihydromonapterin reductase [Marinomonas sp.]
MAVSKIPILITGGGQRLGLACAIALAEEGYDVVITFRTYRESIDILKKMGVRCIQADFSTQSGVDAFVEIIMKDYQGIRAIIHNASDWASEEDAIDPNELMTKMWQIHVFSPYRINLAFESLLYNASATFGMADVIHITDYVVEKGSDNHIAYASSKAGLANLTMSFSKRFAPSVKVNSISPSLLMFNEQDSLEYREKAREKILLSKEPGEQEGVSAVQYLLKSQYMTGRTLSLDGGRHLIK